MSKDLKNSVDNPNSAVDNAAKIKRLYLDTQLGSPVDTVEEFDAQLHNLGPLDSRAEISELDNDDPEHSNINRPK